jgi:uncharacterized protein YjhX (UPF0386 family)
VIKTYVNPLDAEVTKKLKKQKSLSVVDGLSARIKIRKGLANVIGLLSLPYSTETDRALVE